MSNCSPTEESKEVTVNYNVTVQPPLFIGIPGNIDFTFKESVYNEVGVTVTNGIKKEKIKTYHQLIPNGVDSTGNPTYETIAYDQQDFELIPLDENGQVTNSENPYQQVPRPLVTRSCKSNDVFDEQYFAHVFSSSNTFNLSRNIRGVVVQSINIGENPDPEEEDPSIFIPGYIEVGANYTATLTLDKMDIELIYPSTNNFIESSTIYSGGTDSNAIFFKYNSDTSNVIAPGHIINGWTVVKVINYAGSDNQVSTNTICYAEISSGTANFALNTNYSPNQSTISIQIVAGKGIKTKSAVVGTFLSKNKKEIKYFPVFYSKNDNCIPTVIQNDESDYTIGSVILNDDTYYVNNIELCVNPKTEIAAFIDNVYWTNFSMPPTKAKLQYWIQQYNEDKALLETSIINFVTDDLNGKKVYDCIDSECENSLSQKFSRVYYPASNIKTTDTGVETLSGFSSIPSSPYTITELTEIIRNGTQNNSFATSVLPEAMKDQIMTGNMSLQQRMLTAVETAAKSIPTQSFEIPQTSIDGENKSSAELLTSDFRRIPPNIGRIEYYCDGLSFDNADKLSPIDPINSNKMIVRCIPRWIVTNSSLSNPSSGESAVPGTVVNVNTNSNGYLTSITLDKKPFPTTTTGLLTTTKSWVSLNDLDPEDYADYTWNGPYPQSVWGGADVNFQSEFIKKFYFTMEETSNYISQMVENKGNPFVSTPIIARLSKTLSESSTTIEIKDTSEFLSSGYIMIPKFVQLKEISTFNQNVVIKYYYIGEEIIHYNNKTSTSFENCTRQMFGTTTSLNSSDLTPELLSSTPTTKKIVTNSYSLGSYICQFYSYKIPNKSVL